MTTWSYDPGSGATTVTLSAYALPSAVFQMDTGRIYTATSTPASAAVEQYLVQTAAELDGILRGQGYSTPVTVSPALELLSYYNSLGANALALQSAPTGGGKRDEATALWENAKKMLATGEIILDAERDTVNATGSTRYKATALICRDRDV